MRRVSLWWIVEWKLKVEFDVFDFLELLVLALQVIDFIPQLEDSAVFLNIDGQPLLAILVDLCTQALVGLLQLLHLFFKLLNLVIFDIELQPNFVVFAIELRL